MRGSGASRLSVAPGGALAGPWVRNPLWRNARAVPSLDLQFADNKSLVDGVTGQNLVTFTRASSATYTDSAGVLRSAVTNLLLRSEEFGTSPWSVNGSATITADQSQSPTGTTTADLLTSPFGGPNRVNQSATIQASSNYTFSVYVKAVNTNGINLRLFNSGGTIVDTYADFLFSSGAFANITGAGSFASLNAGNGWYRISCTFGNGNNTDCNMRIGGFIGTAQTGTTSLLWGAQLEQSSTVGEYIPTTSTINSAPRFDHNPTTGESLGLLVEEARTNLLLWSEDFGNVIWLYTAASVSTNTSVAPDGTTTADTITSSGTAVTSQAITKAASAITYTASVFVKGTVTNLSFTVDDGATINRGRCVFNLSTGTLSSTSNDGSFTNTSGTITTYPNGWYRITCTTTTNSTTIIARHRFFWSGSGTSIDVWGAQLETGAFPTSYIPTTTATVTRAADVASITGSNFSSWYNQSEGTIWANGTAPNKSVTGNRTRGFVSINAGTQADSILMGHSSTEGSYRGSLLVGNVNQFITNAQQTLASVFTTSNSYTARTCIAYKSNDLIQSANGLLTSPVSSASLPVTDRMTIGDSLTADGYLNGTIRRLCFWPTRLANTTLQQITQP